MHGSILSFMVRDKRTNTYGPYSKSLSKSSRDKINRNCSIMEKKHPQSKIENFQKSHRPMKTDTTYYRTT